MYRNTPDPIAVLRGHHGEVQALDFLSAERSLVTCDAEGEVRAWDLQDLRVASARRAHPVSGGIIQLQAFDWHGRLYLVTQAKDMTISIWQLGDDLQLSKEPLHTIHKLATSFCRFSLLTPFQSQPFSSSAGSNGKAAPFLPAELSGVSDLCSHNPEAAILPGNRDSCSLTEASKTPARPEDAPVEVTAQSAAGEGSSSGLGAGSYASPLPHDCTCSRTPAAAQGTLPPPFLLALPADDNSTIELWCCRCGRHLATVGGQHAQGSKWGMCTALKLFWAQPSGTACLATGYEAGWVAIWALGGSAGPPAVVEATSSSVAAGEDGGAGPEGSPGSPAEHTDSDGGSPAEVCSAAAADFPVQNGGAVPCNSCGVLDAACRPLAARQLHEEPVLALDVDGSGSGGVCGGADARLIFFKIDFAGKAIKVRRAVALKLPGVNDVAIRGDGKIVAAGGWDGRVRVFKYHTGEPLAILKYHRAQVAAVRFSQKTGLLASASRDGTVALWSIYKQKG